MTVVTQQPPTRNWPSEVLEFAKQSQVAEYLDPLLEATRTLFPGAAQPAVFLEHDPEIVDDVHLVWELEIPFTTVTDYVAAQKRWIDELCRICPAPLTCVFRLSLSPVRNGSA